MQTQIAAQSIYTKSLEKGYEIAKDGLYMIARIRKEDFDLHANYFASLKAINPRIRSYWKIAEAIALEEELLQNASKHKRNLKNRSVFSKDELSYIENVYKRLLSRSQNSIAELVGLTTNGMLTMKDNERLDLIDQIYTNVLDRYVFERDFYSQTSQMSLNRAREVSEINGLNTITKIH
ncbi:MAG: hypothetical protein ACXVZU_00675 [Methanobacteriaceae archaeon]